MGIEIKGGNGHCQHSAKVDFLKLINLGYRLVFHEEMSADVQAFLKNVLYVGIATVISTLCTAVFSIMGGRWLGPQEYGKFILIQSVAMFLYIPMELGFNNAMLKYTSEKIDHQRQSNIIISTLLLSVFLTTISIIIYFFISSPLSHLFAIPVNLFYLAVAYATLFVFYSLTTSALRGLSRMRVFAVFQIIYGAIILLSFLAFIFDRQLSFKSMIYPVLLAFGSVIILIFILYIRKLAKWKFDRAISWMLIKYSLFSFIAGLSWVFYSNIDRIMIGKYMTVADVGIYTAYYTASINVAGVFSSMFTLVYFPTISGYKNKGPVFYKVNKFIPYLIGFGIPFIFICEYIVLRFYGVKYSFNMFWMLYFSITSICVVVDGLYTWLLLAISLRGARSYSFIAILMAVINTGGNLILIPKYGIVGAIICLMISYIFAITMKLWMTRNYIRSEIGQTTNNI